MNIQKIKSQQKFSRGIFNFSAKLLVIMALFLLPNLAFGYPANINDLDNKISELQNQLSQKTSERKTLQGQVNNLDSQIYLLQLKIDASQAKINQLNSDIKKTNEEIKATEAELEKYKKELGEILRTSYEEGQQTKIEVIVKSRNFSDFVNQAEYLETLQIKIKDLSVALNNTKLMLDEKRSQLELNKKEQEGLNNELVAQQNGIEEQQNERASLLSQTKGQEANFQTLLQQNIKQRQAEWDAYIRATQGASSSGSSSYTGGSGGGYLAWPMSGYLTQGYGMTSFAASGAYGGKIHNGIDLSSGYGATVVAAADGQVMDTGSASNSQGWGNWVVIRHPNGLATLYAHLNTIYVSPGQGVTRGQGIGLEGWTGNSYPSGPAGRHLHFSVYTNLTLYNVAGYHGPAYDGTTSPYNFL